MTAVVDGPSWSVRGLDAHGSRYPLKVEGAVQRPVSLLLPGISTQSEFVRYFALYGALAAHADERDLDEDACREFVRRSEVVLAGTSTIAGDLGWSAHGADGIRPWLGDSELDVSGAVSMGAEQNSYSPRKSGFWGSYGGPSQDLGTVVLDDRALRPGRHPCPAAVRDFFAPLFAAADHDRLTVGELEALRPVGTLVQDAPEIPWLRNLLTASRDGVHDPGQWRPDDCRRRATMRIIGRATMLHGADPDLSWTRVVESAVAFGDALETDPMLAGIREAEAWRGLLLRNYSVNAWRRLWAALVRSIGAADEHADRSPEELQDWLAGHMPDSTVRAFIDSELPPTTTSGGHPAAAEWAVVDDDDGGGPRADLKLLLLGARRADELTGETRKVFLSRQNEILNPVWMALCVREFLDRPVRDLAVRLVNDMLAQANRVALDKMRPDVTGRLQMYSRVYERNGRYYKTHDEGDTTLGTRLDVTAGIAEQLGLIDVDQAGAAAVTDLGAEVLELTS